MNLIEEVLKLDKEATNPARFKVDRYDHGGGRVSVNDIGGRELIADLYEPASERECWIMCRTAAPKLARALEFALSILEDNYGATKEIESILNEGEAK